MKLSRVRLIVGAAILSGAVAHGQNALPVTSTAVKAEPASKADSKNVASDLDPLPAVPAGKASLIGGTIQNLDPIRDRVIVQVFGGHRTAILFDERTRVYTNGKIASLRDLSEGQHIYAETVLDKADVFARSINIASREMSGQSSGQVLSYDAGDGEVIVRDAILSEPVRLRMNSTTVVLRDGHSVPPTELRPGVLISVTFSTSGQRDLVAQQVSILAQPGADFVFPGRVAYLDLHRHLLVVADSRDGNRYDIDCDPALVSDQLHEGADVTVKARFDGTRYSATAITLNGTSVH